MARALVLAAAAAGCATAQPPTPSLTPEQAVAWQEVQDFIEAIARVYKTSAPTAALAAGHTQGEIAKIKGSYIMIEPRLLSYPKWQRDKVIAHELAHWINGDHHRLRRGFPSYPELYDFMRRIEVEADVMAVEILQRVRGMTECKALATVLNYKQGQIRALADGQIKAWPQGHLPPSEEYKKVLERFPKYQPWTGKCDG